MKKLITLLLLITSFGYGQTLLKLKAIEYAPGAGYTVYTNSLGVQTYSLLSVVSPTTGLQAPTTSITINGVTQSFTSTPTFTVGDLFSTTSYTNPPWLSALPWSKITGTPTTISGYGITDPLIQGSLTANYIPKAVSSTSLTNSEAYFDSDGLNFSANSTLGNISSFPYFWFNKNTKTNSNYSIAHNSNFLIFNANANMPILVRRDNSDPSGLIPVLDFGNSSVPNTIKLNDNYGIGIETGKLLLNTNTTGTVQIGTFDGITVTSKFTFDNSNGKLTTDSIRLNGAANNSIIYTNASKDLKPVILGSGLIFTGGTLTATGSGSTTILTASTNIVINGTAPNYTISTPTQTTGIVSNATHTGDATGSTALTLATVNSNIGTFGGAASISTITVNGKGLTTGIGTVAIQIAQSQVTNLVSDLSSITNSISVNTSSITALNSKSITINGTAAALTSNPVFSVGDVSLTATQTLTNKSLTSPTLTGAPIAPTASVNTNNTQIATTAYADANSALNLKIANNLSDVNNVVTSRNNLKIWDLYLTGGDQSTTSNVASNITDLVFTPTINKRYSFKGVIHIGCNNTGGVKVQVTLPTGSTMFLALNGFSTASTVPLYSSLSASSTLSSAYCTVNSSNGFVFISGEVTIGATAGNIQFGFASTTNTQTSTIYQLGTQILIKQIN